MALKFASNRLKDNMTIVEQAIDRTESDHPKDVKALKYASERIRGDADFMLSCMDHRDGFILEIAAPALLADVEFMKQAVRNYPKGLEMAQGAAHGNKDVFIAAMQGGHIAHHLPQRFQGDRDVAIAWVRSNSEKYKELPLELRQDKDVIKAALAGRSQNIHEHIPAEMLSDKELALHVARVHGELIVILSPEMRADRDVAMAAVKRHGHALQHVDEELQADREIVMTAIEINGKALKHAAPILRADREVVLAAICQNPDALAHASLEYRFDKTLKAQGFLTRQWEAASKGLAETAKTVRKAINSDNSPAP